MKEMQAIILPQIGKAAFTRGLLLMSTAHLLCIAAVPAHAESQTDSGPAGLEPVGAASKNVSSEGAYQDLGDGEIIVTAQRREERLQDVPVTITALTGDQLDRAGITSTQQLTQVTPGLNFTQSSFSPQPTIRGIGTRGVTAGDESVVPVYVDGVYQPALNSTVIELNSIERIEVLKGPQGALLGRNATGGAINIITRTPKVDPEMAFSLSYGRFNQVIGKAYVTGGSGNVAADLAVLYSNDDGYIRDIAKGGMTGKTRSYSLRSKIAWQPVEDLKFTLIGSKAGASESVSYATQARNRNTLARRFNPEVLIPDDPFETSATDRSPIDTTTTNAALLASWDGPGFSINSVSGYQRTTFDSLADSDTTPQFVGTSAGVRKTRSFIQDLYAISAGGGPLTWIVGATYYHDRSGNPSVINVNKSSLAAAPVTTNLTTSVETSSIALWAQLGYDLSDKLDLTIGGRYTHDKKHYQARNNINLAVQPIDTSKSWEKFTPTVTLKYELSPDANVYLKAGQAFKAGIYASSSFSAKPVDPETVTQYELGFKGDLTPWFRLNLAGYYTDYKNVQVNVRDPITLLSGLENAARARIYGLEGDILLRPARNLNIRGGLSLLNAKYRDYVNAQIFVPTGLGGNASATIDASGNRLIRTPSFTFNVSADYRVPLANGSELAASANFFHSGVSYWEASNRVVQPRMDVLNGEVSYLEPSGRVRIALWGLNLLNDKYPRFILSSTTADSQVYAQPRTWGVRVSANF